MSERGSSGASNSGDAEGEFRKVPSRKAIKAELERRKESDSRRSTVLRRVERTKQATPTRMIAYDFETTRIAEGTPRPLYLTAYSGRNPEFSYEGAVRDMPHLLEILETYFLTKANYGVKFVAWMGNRFDAYFVAAALLQSDKYVLRPYLTRSKSLRGLRVIPANVDPKKRKREAWEFVDGDAMLGMNGGVKLSEFLEKFAPHLPKLVGAIDFEREEFDATNPKHCDYAMRDSVGLWAGMDRAQSILLERFNQPLGVTMGGACIKIFQANIPKGVEVPLPREEVLEAVRDFVLRGGYCYCAKRYKGPVWKYDINQAYAAAMRDAKLPCGFTVHSEGKPSDESLPYIARVTARRGARAASVPFYYRTLRDGNVKSVFDADVISETWLTSIEVEQLIAEGWSVTWLESYTWASSFTMYEYVSALEVARQTCDGGPKGPQGTMIKGVGNHSYGKTLEQLEPMEYVISADMPDTFVPYYGEGFEPFEHVFYRFVEEEELRPKEYHQPQLGAFITAHVRMVLRRVILLRPQAWLYSDTDCVVFSEDVTALLDIDETRYGAWKVEEAGAEYLVIAKKVYSAGDGNPKKRSSKGLHARSLQLTDFESWYDGEPPVQVQVQRNNFLKVMQGSEMFRIQRREGTAVEKVK